MCDRRTLKTICAYGTQASDAHGSLATSIATQHDRDSIIRVYTMAVGTSNYDKNTDFKSY